ncbi:MAG: hypothetical protein ACLUIQ_12490 [Dialister invisus]
MMEAERAPAHDFEAQSEYYHVAVQEKKKLTTAPVWPIIISL